MNKALNDIVSRVDSWPESAREELAQLAREIEAEVNSGSYRATPAELAGIDRGLRDSAEGKFASAERWKPSSPSIAVDAGRLDRSGPR